MDKNTIIGLLIMFGLLMGFAFWNSSNQKKQKEEQVKEIVERTTSIQDTIAKTTELDTTESSSEAVTPVSSQKIETESISNSYFYTPDSKNDSISNYVVKTKIATYTMSQKGGYIASVEFNDIFTYTPKGEPKKKLLLYDGKNTAMNIELMLKNQTRIFTKDCHFISSQPNLISVKEGSKQIVSLKLHPQLSSDSSNTPDLNSYIEYLYTFSSNDYRVGFEINLVNMAKFIYPNTQSFTLQWNANPMSVEKSYKTEKDLTSIYFMDNLSKVDNLNERSAEKKDFTSGLKWVSFRQQFFTTVLIADSGNFSSDRKSVV